MFKGKTDLAPNIIEDIFKFRERLLNVRSETNQFITSSIRTTYHGLRFCHMLGSWNMGTSSRCDKRLQTIKIHLKN